MSFVIFMTAERKKMSDNFRKIMQYFTSPCYHYPLNMEFTELLHKEHLFIEHATENEFLIINNMPSRHIYLLLDGYCRTEKYSSNGKLLKSIPSGPIQLYGLFEAVHPTLTVHTASIRCITACSYVRIPNRNYINEVLSDPALGWISIQYLASFINQVLTEHDDLLLNNTRNKILLQLYYYSSTMHFPIIVKTQKEELAQLLNINLRTLYRQLDVLYKEDLISSSHGKIVITEEQYYKIQTLLNTIE